MSCSIKTMGSTKSVNQWMLSDIVKDINICVLTKQNDPGLVSVHWNVVNWWDVLDPCLSTSVQLFMAVMDTILFFLHPSIYTSSINHTDSSSMYNLSKQLSKQVINTYLYYVCMYMHVLTNTGQHMWDRALAIYSV